MLLKVMKVRLLSDASGTQTYSLTCPRITRSLVRVTR